MQRVLQQERVTVIFQSTAPAAADRDANNLWIDTTGGANTPKRVERQRLGGSNR